MLRTRVRMAFASGVLGCVIIAACAFSEEAPSNSIDLGTKDVTAYVVAPSAQQLLESIDAIAKQFLPPDQYKPGMIKMILGAKLNDPQLANLGTKPVVLMVFKVPLGYTPDEGPPPLGLFIPAVKAAPYDDLFNQGGATDFTDGVLTAVPVPSMLKAATAMRPAYDKIASAKITSDVRLYINATSLMGSFGPLLRGILAQTEQNATAAIAKNPLPPDIDVNPELAAKLAKAGLRGVNGLLNQLDWIQLDLKLKPDSITLEEIITAKPDSILATAFSGTAPKFDKNLESLNGKGTVCAESSLSMASLSAAWKKVVDAVAADPELRDLAKEPLVKTVSDSLDSMEGSQCFSMKFNKEGMSITNAAALKDSAKYLELQGKVAELFAKDGFLAKLYEKAGIKVSGALEKKARVYKDVEIGRMTITMDTPNLPEAQKAQMAKIMKPTEMGAVKNYVLSANKPESLNAMIDMATSGTYTDSGFALKSKAVFGEGKNVYADYDLIALMKGTTVADPNNPMGPLFAPLKEGSPVLIAEATSKGQAKIQIQIPIDPIANILKAFQDMAKAFENGGPPKPKAKDDSTF